MKPKLISSGKRKAAVARAFFTDGSGKIIYKNKDLGFLQMFDKLKLEEPLRISQSVLGKLNFDVKITARGGGEKSQIEAARLALAKGIVNLSKSEKLLKAFMEYDRNMLIADVRRKEAYKPGDSKARSNRQTSYR